MFALWLFVFLGDLKSISPEPTLILGRDEKGETLFYKPSDIAFTQTEIFYVLEVGEGRIVKMDLTGKLIATFSRKGLGPGEISNVIRIVAVDQQLWTADRETGRIQIFENEAYQSYFRPKKINAPVSIELIGDEVFIGGRSLGAEYGAIEVYDKHGVFKRFIGQDFAPNNEFAQTAALWDSFVLAEAQQGQLLMGFQFNNRLAILDANGKQMIDRNMKDIYPRFKRKDGGAVYPEGFSAMAFSTGPQDTYLVSTCKVETRSCGKLLQLGKNLKTIVGERDFGSSIRQIRYAPFLGLIAVITGNNEILFFETT